MADRYSTNPLGEEEGERFTFSDATLLTFLCALALAFAAVLVLGSLCAEHRIAAALTLL